LFPFSWPHPYVPVLPDKLFDYLQAPVPFIVGVKEETFYERISELELSEVTKKKRTNFLSFFFLNSLLITFLFALLQLFVVYTKTNVVKFPPSLVPFPLLHRDKLMGVLNGFSVRTMYPDLPQDSDPLNISSDSDTEQSSESAMPQQEMKTDDFEMVYDPEKGWHLVEKKQPVQPNKTRPKSADIKDPVLFLRTGCLNIFVSLMKVIDKLNTFFF
jgi:hypothetical protein